MAMVSWVVERPGNVKTPLASLQSSQIYAEKLALLCHELGVVGNGSVMYCVLMFCFIHDVNVVNAETFHQGENRTVAGLCH